MNDELLIRLLNIAQDVFDCVDRIEELHPEPEMTEKETVAWMRHVWEHVKEHGHCPPMSPEAQAINDANGPGSDIQDIVLDLMGVPADNTLEFMGRGILTTDTDDGFPEGCFCRDWANEQFFEAGKSRNFQEAIDSIRKAMRDGELPCQPASIQVLVRPEEIFGSGE